MAFSFSKKYNVTRKFNIDTEDFDYISLEDLFNRIGRDEDIAIEIRGVYINTRGNYDDAPVLAIDDCYVNLPAHLTPVCQKMLEDDRCIQAINEGRCGFKIYKYHQKKHDKDCYSVEWVDI